MVEHLTFNQVVLGSSPSGLTNKINGLARIFSRVASQISHPAHGKQPEPCAACIVSRLRLLPRRAESRTSGLCACPHSRDCAAAAEPPPTSTTSNRERTTRLEYAADDLPIGADHVEVVHVGGIVARRIAWAAKRAHRSRLHPCHFLRATARPWNPRPVPRQKSPTPSTPLVAQCPLVVTSDIVENAVLTPVRLQRTGGRCHGLARPRHGPSRGRRGRTLSGDENLIGSAFIWLSVASR